MASGDYIIGSDTSVIVEVITPVTEIIEVVSPGPQGPPGTSSVDYNQLLQDVDDAVQDYYVLHPDSWSHDQTSAVYHWEIVHPLDHRPSVVIIDSSGNEWEGEVTWPSLNTVDINFNIPLAGTAILT